MEKTKAQHGGKATAESFSRRFGTEEKCRRVLLKLRFPLGFKCPKCGSERFGLVKTRNLRQCKDCRHQTSVTSGTAINKTHLPLRTWLRAIWLFANDKRGCSACHLSRELGLRYATAWYVLARLRSAMSKADKHELLAGTVEIDRADFGKTARRPARSQCGQSATRRSGNRKTRVVAALSKGGKGEVGRAKMGFVRDFRAASIGRFVRKSVSQGALVKTKRWRAFCRPTAPRFFARLTVEDADKRMARWVGILVKNAKAMLQGTYHCAVSARYFQFYLDEFCFRYNRRSCATNLWRELSRAAMQSPPCKTRRFAVQSG